MASPWCGIARAAQRMRAMLPGGSGIAPSILAHLDGPGTSAFPAASRVSISELLCVKNVSTDDGRQSARAHYPFSRAPAAAAPCPSPYE